jgi:hypothetical protein
MLTFTTVLSDEDKNWKKFWETIIERNHYFYTGKEIVKIYQDISNLIEKEATEELSEHFLHLYQDVRDFDKDVKTYGIKRERIKVFDKEVTDYDLEKGIVELKLSSNCLITIQYCEGMWTENIFDDDFNITIKFSSVEEFAKWVYDNYYIRE